MLKDFEIHLDGSVNFSTKSLHMFEIGFLLSWIEIVKVYLLNSGFCFSLIIFLQSSSIAIRTDINSKKEQFMLLRSIIFVLT